ncbi:MAG TPA: sugar porter family MFS transporter, partial [Gemmatirosa sp.]
MTSRTSVVFSALVAALGGLLFGFDTAVISGTTDALQRVFALDAAGLGFAVTAALIGTIVGAFTAGPPAERLGRRRVLFVLALFFLVAAVGSAMAASLPVFVAFRFLGGLGVGGASVVAPLYIAEIAPARLRGRLVALNQLNIVAGILIAFCSNLVIARAMPAASAWRWMLGVQAFPAAVFFGLLFLIPESPRWLAKEGRLDEARRVLARVGEGGAAGADAELAAITDSLDEGRAQAHAAGGAHVHARLFQRRYSRPIGLAMTIAVFNQLSGINAILYYAPRVFQQAGAGKESSLAQSVAVGGTNLVFTIVALFIIDRFGRRPLLAVGGLGAALSLGLTALGFSMHGGSSATLVLAGILGFIACHAIGRAVPADTAWRWMLGVQAVPAAVFFALLFLIPESPRWLAKQGRLAEARQVLARVGEGGAAGADAELGAIAASLDEGRAQAHAAGGAHVHAQLLQRRYSRPIFLAITIA